MDFSKIQTALDAIPDLVTVEHATEMDYAGFSVETSKVPAVFYHPWGESRMGGGAIGSQKPDRMISFALRIVTKREDLDSIKNQIENALTGLKINDTALTTVEWSEGQTINVDRTLVYWREIYSFKTTA